jgi:ribosome-associated toxin RatA of RatAB toxin-antitoxin module
MDLSKYHLTVSVTVAASPEAVYDIISDVTRVGEFSPVCKSAEWTADDHRAFAGTNEMGDRQWTTHCRVDVAERGKEFTFVNQGQDGANDLVRWSYTFAPSGDGAEVSEHWQLLPAYPELFAGRMSDEDTLAQLDASIDRTRGSIEATLAALKAAAES